MSTREWPEAGQSSAEISAQKTVIHKEEENFHNIRRGPRGSRDKGKGIPLAVVEKAMGLPNRQWRHEAIEKNGTFPMLQSSFPLASFQS